MKIIFLLLTFLTFGISLAFAQSVDEIKADYNTYIFGEGEGNTIRSADQQAISILTSQISVQVSHVLEGKITSTVVGGSEAIIKNFQSTVSSYSKATLNNARLIIISEEPNVKVLRYMRIEDVKKVFKERELKMQGFVANAEYAKENFKIADALRYYYWAYILLQSHPDGNELTFTDRSGHSNLLTTWLPLQINDIFSGLQFEIIDKEIKDDNTSYILNIGFRGQVVENFEYSYWDGMSFTNQVSARNGTAYIELFGINAETSTLRIKAEYKFEAEAKIDRELEEVLSNTASFPFSKSEFRLRIPGNLGEKSASDFQSQPENPIISEKKTLAFGTANVQVTTQKSVEIPSSSNIITKESEQTIPQTNSGPIVKESVKYNSYSKVEDDDCYRKSIETILTSIKTKNYSAPINEFTPEGYSIYEKLVTYGQAKFIGTPELNFIRFKDQVICRSVPIGFSFSANNKQFLEDLIFYFNKDKKIENLTFSLSTYTLKSIAENDFWKAEERLVLINFLETYKTAYALKRINYLNQIFSDNAIIITGYVVKLAPDETNNFQDKEIVKYNRQTKQEYLKNLQRSFDSKEYININFEKCTVKKASKGGEIFGIQVKQNYYSSNYGDTGYLFLLVDINNPNEPIIHVRTWQPETGVDDTIYGLQDFF